LRTLIPGTLRIETYFVNPPFEYVAKGVEVGFEVDLMKCDEARRESELTQEEVERAVSFDCS
jgi:hypothetical protein